MINLVTGQFQLDGHKQIIAPRMTLSEFQAGDIPIRETKSSDETGFTTCSVRGWINGLNADFFLTFEHDKLFSMEIVQAASRSLWEGFYREEKTARNQGHQAWAEAFEKLGEELADAQQLQKQQNDAWLAKTIGSPPPYDCDWGTLASEQDIHNGDAVIVARFR